MVISTELCHSFYGEQALPVEQHLEEVSPGRPPERRTLRIEYPLSVLNEIRTAVVDAYLSLPHGGLETGGVLFGTRTEDAVRIMNHRPIPCEHAAGPSFTLSDNDREKLDVLL